MATLSALESFVLDSREVDRELACFTETARVGSAEHACLLDSHPHQWVALYRNEVRATASTLRSVLVELERENVPRQHVVVRWIERGRRTLIL